MSDLLSREEMSIVDLVSEGPIEGPVDKNGSILPVGKRLYESIYINGVPVKNFNKDTYNFRYVSAQFRKGEQIQSSLGGGGVGKPFKTQNNTTTTNRSLIGPYGDTAESISASESNGGVPASFYVETQRFQKQRLLFCLGFPK